MSIANPTISIAARAAFTDPELYVANFLFPRVPLEGAAIRPDDNAYRGTAYRVKNATNLQQTGEADYKATQFAELPRVFPTLESYEVDAQLYGVTSPIGAESLATMQRFGIVNYENDVVAPQIAQVLLIDREFRAKAVIDDTANFQANYTSTDGLWTDGSVDPLEQVEEAIQTIEQAGGTLEEGQIYRFMFSDADFRAFVDNPQIRARFGDAAAPTAPGDVINLLQNTVLAGYPARYRNAFEIRLAKAVGTRTNLGQNPTPAYIISGKSALVRSIPATQGTANDGLRRRAWGKGYSGFDLTIDSYLKDFEGTSGVQYYRGKHATTESVFDKTLGVCWTAISG
jgi:hypothetical protein